MKYLRILTAIVASVGIATAASATTVQGTLSYDDEPIGSTFTNFDHGLVAARNSETQQWVYGTADPATGSYSISGLTSGQWFVRVLFGADEIDGVFAPSDEVTGYSYVTVANEPTLSFDLVGYLAYRIIQPFDSTQP